jgi:hypothetical protein
MAEHVWTVLCHSTLIDPETKAISLFQVAEKLTLHPIAGGELVERELERVQSEGKRGLHFPVQMRLISWWVRTDPSRGEMIEPRISLLNPAGERLLEQVVPLDLERYASQRLTMHFDKLQITHLGRYWFVLEQPKGTKNKPKWATVARIPLDVEAAASTSES